MDQMLIEKEQITSSYNDAEKDALQVQMQEMI